ncbi:uncharacterized protein LOC122267252 isoform X1 [Penaeus japonicus]|uniref:uncharacterized protein LOC122267252 isoform X1 n=2 Tax=Penaeus japonicus TaxID=27405 RepID=UPI001C70E73F|nr:uncharacterized protein LOC122267252 isoform X1 [Penaeus japonicus]
MKNEAGKLTLLKRTRMRCRGRNGEPLLVVDRCCCFSLRTGALVLASCEIICLLAIVILNIAVHRNKEGAAVVVEGLLHIGVASVLIHGVRTKQNQLVWAWVLVRTVLLVMEMPVVFIYSVFTDLTFTLCLLGISLLVCCSILIVRSYALSMDTDEERVNLEEVSTNTFTALEDEARV